MTSTLTLLTCSLKTKQHGCVYTEAMKLLFVQQAFGMPAIVARHNALATVCLQTLEGGTNGGGGGGGEIVRSILCDAFPMHG